MINRGNYWVSASAVMAEMQSGSSLVRMLISGLVLIVLGMIGVVLLV